MVGLVAERAEYTVEGVPENLSGRIVVSVTFCDVSDMERAWIFVSG